MKTKPCIYLQPNYLLFRTAIGAVSGTIGVLAVVIASTGFVNFKSGIFIQSNTSGNRKTRIPYTSVDSGEQYKFIGGK
ncbi:hypothetical protein E4N83_03585 [Treponema denticola]|uniref:hypothetical protein n=1 Tax=Treponema denticola TaxID=158 RepID=UPI0020A2E883|nr:hypothetical protein [Treponema denticola]UTC97380.1 hypothetical protein E4N83_03585 [Treponema denticola]